MREPAGAVGKAAQVKVEDSAGAQAKAGDAAKVEAPAEAREKAAAWVANRISRRIT